MTHQFARYPYQPPATPECVDPEYDERQTEFWTIHKPRPDLDEYLERREAAETLYYEERERLNDPLMNGRAAFGAIVWGLTMMLLYSIGIVGV